MQLQAGIDCTGLLYRPMRDMICKRVCGACRMLHSVCASVCHAIGSPPGRGFEKGFLIRKSTEKCVWEGVPHQKGAPEMGF